MKGHKLAEKIQDLIDGRVESECAAEAAAWDAGLAAVLAQLPQDAGALRQAVMDLEALALGWQIAAAEAGYRLGLEHGARAGGPLAATVKTVRATRQTM